MDIGLLKLRLFERYLAAYPEDLGDFEDEQHQIEAEILQGFPNLQPTHAWMTKGGAEPRETRAARFAETRADQLLPYILEVRPGLGADDPLTDQELRAATARQMREVNTAALTMMRDKIEKIEDPARKKVMQGFLAMNDLGGAMDEQAFLDGDAEAMERIMDDLRDRGLKRIEEQNRPATA